MRRVTHSDFTLFKVEKVAKSNGCATLQGVPDRGFMPIRVVIVEDHALLAQSLGSWISRHSQFELVGEAADGLEGLKLCMDQKPDLALVDIELPRLGGLDLIRKLFPLSPSIRILIMSGRTDPDTIWKVMQSGSHGYIEKNLKPENLVEALEKIARGGTFFSETFLKVKSAMLSDPDAFQKILSEREQDVLRLVAAGMPDVQISVKLAISTSTVAVHRKNVRHKLGLHNDRELVAYARQWGLDKTAPADPSA